MESDRDVFLLSPKNQDRLFKIMSELERQGYPTNNLVLTLVLQEMRKKGILLQADNKEMLEHIKKLVPKGGKILHIKGDDNGRE